MRQLLRRSISIFADVKERKETARVVTYQGHKYRAVLSGYIYYICTLCLELSETTQLFAWQCHSYDVVWSYSTTTVRLELSSGGFLRTFCLLCLGSAMLYVIHQIIHLNTCISNTTYNISACLLLKVSYSCLSRVTYFSKATLSEDLERIEVDQGVLSKAYHLLVRGLPH